MQGSTNVAFGYDNAGRRTSATLPNGIRAAYVYDAASELTSIAYKTSGGTTLGTLTYSYGPDGWVSSRSGTLFTSVLPAAVMSSTYNAGNQLTARTTSGGTQSPTWDANGSLSSDGLNAYTWDARNRMTAIGSLASFVYDAFGRRVSATKSGTTTAYPYSDTDVVQEQQGGSATANLPLTPSTGVLNLRRRSADSSPQSRSRQVERSATSAFCRHGSSQPSPAAVPFAGRYSQPTKPA